MLESNANVVPTDDTATRSKKLVPGVDSGVKCIGGSGNVDRGAMIANSARASAKLKQVRCDHVTHDS